MVGICAAVWAADVPILKVTDAGVGPLGAQTEATASSLKRALPGFTIRQTTVASEDRVVPLLSVTRGRQVAMEVLPGDRPGSKKSYIGRIVVRMPEIMRRSGFSPGRRFADFYPDSQKAVCKPGLEQNAGKFFCLAPGMQHVGLEFPSAPGAADGTIWPQAGLTAVIWTPEAFDRYHWTPID
ncbi:DUF1131 family protein [Paludibacterium purpuratum]|nr:DUF1131 family protein [Paludibacterium purpuratum]